jgi:hypothetical protein
MKNAALVLITVCFAGSCLVSAQVSIPAQGCWDSFPEKWIDGAGALRFYSQGSDVMMTVLEDPLVLLAVDDKDARIGTTKRTTLGQTLFVSKPEMRGLEEMIARLQMPWCLSAQTGELEGARSLHSTGNLDLTIRFSKGTAIGQIRPGQVCDALASLDPAFKGARTLWEFQSYRQLFSCRLPHFDSKAYSGR